MAIPVRTLASAGLEVDKLVAKINKSGRFGLALCIEFEKVAVKIECLFDISNL